MIVTRQNFEACLAELKQPSHGIGLDTETFGLRPYHGDNLFSIILTRIAGEPGEDKEPALSPFYFNFKPYSGLASDFVLLPSHLAKLKAELFDDPERLWYIHNAKYDMAILANDGIELAGTIHCTQAIARVEYNDHIKYSLGDCGDRIGYKKDKTVEKYILENGHWEWHQRPGKQKREKNLHYDRVPFQLIVPYGIQDTVVGAHLGYGQTQTLSKLAESQPEEIKITRILKMERRLTKTVFRIEQRGVLIDKPYCVRAEAYENDRAQKALLAFKRETGKDFSASGKLFQHVFESEKAKWEFTEKGNPSFEGDILKKFQNPAAKLILEYRDAKSRGDFYAGFLYFADRDGFVHPNLNPGGTASGRFSSSAPNLQNLTSENASICRKCKEEFEGIVSECKECKSTDIEYPEFLVRRAIIPRPGFFFIMPDYDQMEYRMMFDYACQEVGYETELVKKIKYEGLDPHQATADVVTEGGTPLTRKRAKNGNFATLYGSGYDTLAETIGSTREEAIALKRAIFSAAPEIDTFIRGVKQAIYETGYIRTWAGRRSYFRDPNDAYKGPNYLIQGGCADVNKIALNRIDERLLGFKSRLALTIHDENPGEIHEDEAHIVPKLVKETMESVYPHKFLPLTAGMEYSRQSLADKRKGFPG